MTRRFNAFVLGACRFSAAVVFPVVFSVVFAATADAQDRPADIVRDSSTERHVTSIAQLMRDDEIEATGIRELAPEQLAALSQWLQRYEAAVAQRVFEMAEEEFAPPTSTIQTQIDGSFDGWVGDTVFRLKNGQIWQQVSPSAKYYTAQSPTVTITRTPFLLHVDGVAVDIEVQRIR